MKKSFIDYVEEIQVINEGTWDMPKNEFDNFLGAVNEIKDALDDLETEDEKDEFYEKLMIKFEAGGFDKETDALVERLIGTSMEIGSKEKEKIKDVMIKNQDKNGTEPRTALLAVTNILDAFIREMDI